MLRTVGCPVALFAMIAAGCGSIGDDNRSPTAPTPGATASSTRPPATPTPLDEGLTPAPVATQAPPSSPTASISAGGESGIAGTVLIGPTCPVETLESPCPDRPYEATILVLDAAGTQVAEARSDSAGTFLVLLPAGTYTLRPLSPGALPFAGEQSVNVTSGTVTSIRIDYDSGIR